MQTITKEEVYKILERVKDPEIPVLTILDMGVIRDIKLDGDDVEVIITPTYSGCPAMDMIEVEIKSVLQENGFQNPKVTTILSPAWTTDWLSENGRKKLKEYGIAPPVEPSKDKNVLFQDERKVQCPQCDSFDTKLVSQFGSTPCKSLYKCNSCLEPFDYFKCH